MIRLFFCPSPFQSSQFWVHIIYVIFFPCWENKRKTTNVAADSQLLKPKGPAKDGEWAIPRVYRLRWLMVSLFACCSATNAYQWIHLNIIGNIIHRYYNESLPGTPYQQQVAAATPCISDFRSSVIISTNTLHEIYYKLF